MPRLVLDNDQLIVQYREGSNKKTDHFNLLLDYFNGQAAFTLHVEERPRGGTPRVLRAEIDLAETTVNPETVAADLADVRWHIFPSEARRRKIPPIVAYWEKGGLLVAACLSDRYTTQRLSFAEQQEWFDRGVLPPESWLCRWPSRSAWQVAKSSIRHLNSFPAQNLVVSFFTLGEWMQRPEVRAKLLEHTSDLAELDDDPETCAEIMAEIAAEEYSRYVRDIRTLLLYYRTRGAPVKVVMGDSQRAKSHFAEKQLDPQDSVAWASAALVFDEMPDFWVETVSPYGPFGAVKPNQTLRAALSFINHWPGVSLEPDAIGAAVFAGTRHLYSVVAWLNPLAGPDALSRAADALVEKLTHAGVAEFAYIDGILPFELCVCCGRLSLRAPSDWSAPAGVD